MARTKQYEIGLGNLYETKRVEFLQNQLKNVNFNQACKHSLAYQSEEARRVIVEEFSSCFGRSSTSVSDLLEELESETTELILKCCDLDQEEWQVMYNFSNTTDAIKTAVDIICEQEDDRYTKFFINKYSHSSLVAPIIERCKLSDKISFSVYEKDFVSSSIPLSSILTKGLTSNLVRMKAANYFSENRIVVALPYIDNLFAINHLADLKQSGGLYNMITKSTRGDNIFDNNLEIILDAAQAGENLFLNTIYKPKQTKPSDSNSFTPDTEIFGDRARGMLKYCSAICFGTHKFHGYNMGILIIKKSKLKKIKDYSRFAVGGGSIENYPTKKSDMSNSRFYLNEFNFTYNNNELRGGTKRVEEYIAFGAYIHFLNKTLPKQFYDKQYLGSATSVVSQLKTVQYTLNTLSTKIESLNLNNIKVIYPNDIDNYMKRKKYFSRNCIVKSLYMTSQMLYYELLSDGIETRFGEFCNQLYFSTEESGFVRISTSIANDQDSVDKLLESLERINQKIEDAKYTSNTNSI